MTKTTSEAEALGMLSSTSFDLDLATLRTIIDDAGTDILKIDDLDYLGLARNIPVLIDRKSGTAKSIKSLLEEYRITPIRKAGTATVNTLESFTALTNRHKTAASTIFADTDWRNPSLTAIIDYHEDVQGGTPDNGKHRIHYPFPLSEEWQAWVAKDGKPMDQTAFAEWIEEHLQDLAAPDAREAEEFEQKFNFKVAAPNEMVKLSRGLQIHVESRVKQSVTLQSGEGEITWDEEHKDAGGNKIVVPGLFILSVPPFFMGEAVRIPVRLRYRASGGAIVWTFKLFRPDVYITEQVTRDLAAAAEQTSLPAFQGKPEMSA